MSALNDICEAFPEHAVELNTRPDGSVLLILSKRDEVTLRKVIDRAVISSHDDARGLMREVLRDMKIAQGNITWNGKDSQWLSGELPTYKGGPIQLTAAKKLFAQRKIAVSKTA